MSNPTLENIAARAGRYPSTAERFGDKEAKLAESVKTYVDANAGGGLSGATVVDPSNYQLESNTVYMIETTAGGMSVRLPEKATSAEGDKVELYAKGTANPDLFPHTSDADFLQGVFAVGYNSQASTTVPRGGVISFTFIDGNWTIIP